MDKELIERMYNNLAEFLYLPENTKKKFKIIPKDKIIFLKVDGEWEPMADDDPFMSDFIYLLSTNFTPEPEVIRCEVRTTADYTKLDFVLDSVCYNLERALEITNFIAYEYADGGKSTFPRLYNSTGTISAEYPVAVLFAK